MAAFYTTRPAHFGAKRVIAEPAGPGVTVPLSRRCAGNDGCGERGVGVTVPLSRRCACPEETKHSCFIGSPNAIARLFFLLHLEGVKTK